jgi:6-phosphogluconolactonase
MAFEPSLVAFASREAMAERLADFIADALGRAVAERGAAALAVSGGSTPEAFYRALSERRLDWSKATAALVDERWVPPGAEGSNESFIRSALKKNKAVPVNVVGLWSDTTSPGAGLLAAQARFSAVADPFDVVVLGIGNDGHTASWFPHAEGLGAALSEAGPRLAAVTAKKSAVTGDHLQRMTLTLGAVKTAAHIVLLCAGEDKRNTYLRALESGPVEEMPVRAILRARPDLWACWAP